MAIDRIHQWKTLSDPGWKTGTPPTKGSWNTNLPPDQQIKQYDVQIRNATAAIDSIQKQLKALKDPGSKNKTAQRHYQAQKRTLESQLKQQQSALTSAISGKNKIYE